MNMKEGVKRRMNNQSGINVLIIGDSEDDTLLLIRLLQKGGYDPKYKRVETPKAMHEALERETWDIVISDYEMLRFNGIEALKLYNEKGLDIPFMIVSGAIGEEAAVEAMKAGVHDCMMKNNLPRLVPAVQMELKEAESRRARKRAEEELKQTLEKLRKSLIGTIQTMALSVETRDPYSAGHQRRVSNLALTIAQEMGLSSDTIDTINMAGTIHDIGKISVPEEILRKPGTLTDIEMSPVEAHSQTGYDILKDAGLPYPIAEIVLQHHERLDGSGYPQGLKGNRILMEAKIISVADVVEALTSHRSYRPARGIDAALQVIEKNKGILDERVVEVCLKLFQEKGFSLECIANSYGK